MTGDLYDCDYKRVASGMHDACTAKMGLIWSYCSALSGFHHDGVPVSLFFSHERTARSH